MEKRLRLSFRDFSLVVCFVTVNISLELDF